MIAFTFLRRIVARLFGWPRRQAPALRQIDRQRMAQAIQQGRANATAATAATRAQAAPPAGPPARLPSPITRSIRPRSRIVSVRAARASYRPRPLAAGGGTPPTPPTPFTAGSAEYWQFVSSSWIRALRFVSTDPIGTNPRSLSGFVDMRVHNSKYPIYRYGPGVKWREFDKWLAAASKGKFWWRVWTARWSPATKI